MGGHQGGSQHGFTLLHCGVTTIVNGKCGRCSEDCKYCAQSAHYQAKCTEAYGLLPKEELLRGARQNAEKGVLRYSIVTSGRKLSVREVEQACDSIRAIRAEVLPPASRIDASGIRKRKTATQRLASSSVRGSRCSRGVPGMGFRMASRSVCPSACWKNGSFGKSEKPEPPGCFRQLL